jgi:hypothetical protein
MKRIYVIILVFTGLAILAVAGAYWYAFLRPHPDMMKAKPAYTLESARLFNEFSEDEKAAYGKYAGEVLEVTGEIVHVRRDEKQTAVILNDVFMGVSVYLDSSFVENNRKIVDALDSGQKVTIRGQCDGMLTDVIISRAVIIQ